MGQQGGHMSEEVITVRPRQRVLRSREGGYEVTCVLFQPDAVDEETCAITTDPLAENSQAVLENEHVVPEEPLLAAISLP
eukprot:1110674-Rhodomonas_salina.1